MPAHLLDDSLAEMEARLDAWGEPAYRARQVARWALREGVTTFDAMTDLPGALRARLAEAYTLAPPAELARTAADDGLTTKVLLDLGGSEPGAPGFDAVEAVRMDYDPDRHEHAAGTRGRSTVCVSTQAGCAMGCVFCATGQQGFTRNLTTSEILAQVLHFTRGDAGSRVSNVVFMGMGEPLANYDPTLRAVRWLIDPHGLDMRARGITISTVGLEAPIRRLAAEGLQVGLTVSLHAPDDELRRQLIPTAGGVTIDGLLDASREYVERTGRRVTFAYALLEGVNDEPPVIRGRNLDCRCVERQDAVVETVQAALALGHDRRLEAAVAVARNRQLDRAVLGQHRLARMAVAAVARAAACRIALLVAQAIGQLGAQRPLQKRLLQLLEKPLIAQKVFRRLVIGQQPVWKFRSQSRHRRSSHTRFRTRQPLLHKISDSLGRRGPADPRHSDTHRAWWLVSLSVSSYAHEVGKRQMTNPDADPKYPAGV